MLDVFLAFLGFETMDYRVTKNLLAYEKHWRQMRNAKHVSQGFKMPYPDAGWPFKIDIIL